MNLAQKFFRQALEKGLSSALWKTGAFARETLIRLKGDPVQDRRRQVSNEVVRHLNSTVSYGPFKGLKLPEDSWLGRPARGSMLLGLYEQEVLESLLRLPPSHKTFIDLGAADGYYSIGVLKSGLMERTHCFEISEHGQKVIRENAVLNGISKDKLFVHGVAQKDFYRLLPSEQLSTSVVLVDIEGAEFELFESDVFKKFTGAVMFIELHDFYFEDGSEKIEKLRKAASELFIITELTTTSRDLSKFPELRDFTDNDRWLICSEGRGRLMKWWRLDPKKIAAVDDNHLS